MEKVSWELRTKGFGNVKNIGSSHGAKKTPGFPPLTKLIPPPKLLFFCSDTKRYVPRELRLLNYCFFP